MNNKYYYVYILASKKNGTLYLGVTNDLLRRSWEHKNKIFKGFTDKYDINKLVYYEIYSNINEAINRESQLKNWKREWKLKLIEKENKNWNDLHDFLDSGSSPE